MDETRRIFPSEKCPKCGAFVDRRELDANKGRCNHCVGSVTYQVVEERGRMVVTSEGKITNGS